MFFVATQQKKYNFFAFAAPKFGSYGKYSYLCTQKIVLVNRKATLTVVLLCRLSGAVFLFVLLWNILVNYRIVGNETPMTIRLFPPI